MITCSGGHYSVKVEAVRSVLDNDQIFADDFESGNTSSWDHTESPIPQGAVLFFTETSCPEGWTRLDNQSRLVVGTPNGGNTGTALGTGLPDLVAPVHYHQLSRTANTSSDSSHVHFWSALSADFNWWSYSSSNIPVFMYEWTNGIDNDGVGYYPFAAQVDTEWFTSGSSAHTHELVVSADTSTTIHTLPFIQLLICVKQ